VNTLTAEWQSPKVEVMLATMVTRYSLCAVNEPVVTIYTQEETGVSVITLEDQAAQLKNYGTATTP
jgi:hypothetical protein